METVVNRIVMHKHCCQPHYQGHVRANKLIWKISIRKENPVCLKIREIWKGWYVVLFQSSRGGEDFIGCKELHGGKF